MSWAGSVSWAGSGTLGWSRGVRVQSMRARRVGLEQSEFDLLPVLRPDAASGPGLAGTDTAVRHSQIAQVMRSCVHGKLAGHAINDPSFLQPQRGMNAIGG